MDDDARRITLTDVPLDLAELVDRQVAAALNGEVEKLIARGAGNLLSRRVS